MRSGARYILYMDVETTPKVSIVTGSDRAHPSLWAGSRKPRPIPTLLRFSSDYPDLDVSYATILGPAGYNGYPSRVEQVRSYDGLRIAQNASICYLSSLKSNISSNNQSGPENPTAHYAPHIYIELPMTYALAGAELSPSRCLLHTS